MLLNKLFFIDTLEKTEGLIRADIHIDETHPIFEGHFPGQPVLPGVCMLEMLKEILEQANATNYLLESAATVKFLTMFTPPQCKTAVFEIKTAILPEDKLSVNATLKFEQLVFLKFSGIYKHDQA
jgi:3-hydroxyacyl-[acyl-carrier-protein] dehydratase